MGYIMFDHILEKLQDIVDNVSDDEFSQFLKKAAEKKKEQELPLSEEVEAISKKNKVKIGLKPVVMNVKLVSFDIVKSGGVNRIDVQKLHTTKSLLPNKYSKKNNIVVV